jgi:hypothetical protein
MVRRITQIDVLDGKVDPPEGYKIPELLANKLNEWEHGPEAH